MKKAIIGGVITLIIGGTGFTISQADVADKFAQETGMSQQQAQQYVDSAQNDLDSFSNIGQELATDGNSILSEASQIDCVNYSYQWETPSLSCFSGKNQLQTIGNAEVQLGNCYTALGSDLGGAAKSKISECIRDIDSVNSSYNLPITTLLDSSQVAEMKNSNLYNKSVLRAALESN